MSQTLPDFSRIRFLPPGERSKTVEPAEKILLFKFFNAVLQKEALDVDEFQLEEFFCEDLTINTKKFDRKLVNILREALVYYMTVWPGWQRSEEYYKGQLQCKEWYERFRQYLIFKSNFIIKNAQKFAEEVGSEFRSKAKDADTQTTISEIYKGSEKKVAPYRLCVGGPPSVLNNMIFMESGGSILIKQHLEKEWRPLRLKEFLNWLHVSVEVNLPDIAVSRSNSHKFERYIALCGDLTLIPDVNYINHIKRIIETGEIQPYTYEYISLYLHQLSQVLKKIPGIDADRLKELSGVFTEFLADIKEVNVYNCSMCSNISIGYHVGKCHYIRNKKMVSSDPKKKTNEQNTINFYEILLPQVDFSLHRFSAVQDEQDQSGISFKSLNQLVKLIDSEKNHGNLLNLPAIKNIRDSVNNSCITYKCTFCSESFSDSHAYYNLTNHFLVHHKSEQAMLCFKCRKEFTVQTLAGQRWKHICVEQKSSTS